MVLGLWGLGLAEDGGLLQVLPLAVHLKFFLMDIFLTFLTFLWDPSFMLKSYGWVVGGGGSLQDFIVSPSPLWV